MRKCKQMSKLFILDIDDYLECIPSNEILSLISQNKKNRIAQYKNKYNINQCIYADLLLIFVLMEYYNKSLSAELIETDVYGKPYLRNHSLEFNLSHSGGKIICGISNENIGVDIEKITLKKHEIFIPAFFSEKDIKYIFEDDDKMVNRFYKIWVKYESYSKMVGKGIPYLYQNNNKESLDEANFYLHVLCEDYIVGIYCIEQISDIVHVSMERINTFFERKLHYETSIK